MKYQCPKCKGTICRFGDIEKPFFCPTCKIWYEEKEVIIPLTNAECIRKMTDEELTMFLAETSYCSDWCQLYEECKGKSEYSSCLNVWYNWLKKEVKT